MATPYRLEVVVHDGYLQATAHGMHTQENMSRFLGEVYKACLANRKDSVLLDIQFEGPSMGTSSIFSVVQERIAQAQELRRIAYIDAVRDPAKTGFAETVARNRGVNVRLFASVEQAKAWLEG